MRLLVSWLRDFVDVTASAEEIGEALGIRGFELAGIEAFGDGDTVIDFEITANRPDCLSVIGLAREVATLYDLPMKDVRLKPDAPGTAAVGAPDAPTGVSATGFTVTIEDVELCPRYAAAVAEVSIGPSPPWMASRLQAAGVRSISSIVDVTNYVLLELGHPTHAFDMTRLAGPAIRVRRAAAGERLTTLDGVERPLDRDMLVIADRDRGQAVAGVMGGATAEVSASTRTVVFESAYFKPASVRRTSRRLGLKTEASSRFERGTDINAPVLALRRIAWLMDSIGAGRFTAPVIDVYPAPRTPMTINLRRGRLAMLLGAHVPDGDVERILTRLGFMVSASPDGWRVVVPTVRVDVLREVDLIEEVGRHYGFDRLVATFPAAVAPAPPPDPRIARDATARRALCAAGLSEAVTFGIIEAKAAGAFVADGGERPIAVANPLSAKFDTLRASLLPGLVDAVARNRRHGRNDVAMFEIGTRFSSAGETRGVAIAVTGAAAPVHWSGAPRTVDFFDAKGIVERLCAALDVTIGCTPQREDFLVPGQTAAIVASGDTVGIVGQLLPAVADARGLPRQDPVFVAELNLDRLWTLREITDGAARPMARHPFVVRDVSIVVPDALPAEIIRGTIQSAGGATAAPLTAIEFFDRYQGKGIAAGSVSISVRLTFQAVDRTLTDAEVQAGVDGIVAALVREHRAVQR